MIKIQDIRSDNSKQLKDIEPNGFFYEDDVLYRRIYTDLDMRCKELGDDEILVMGMATGKVVGADRLTWVEPIADRQVFLEISD